MTWTFTSTDLSGTREQIRTYIGDTDTNDQLLTDEQVAYAYTAAGSVTAAAALAAEWIAAALARQADKQVGDLSIKHSQRAAQYLQLAATLSARSARIALPYAGGISQAAKDSREADTDRVEPSFTITMLDDETLSSADDSSADTDVS